MGDKTRILELYSKRLPVRALHDVLKEEKINHETLQGHGIHDATIAAILGKEGIDISALIAKKIDVILDGRYVEEGDGVFNIVDPEMRGTLNPLFESVRLLVLAVLQQENS